MSDKAVNKAKNFSFHNVFSNARTIDIDSRLPPNRLKLGLSLTLLCTKKGGKLEQRFLFSYSEWNFREYIFNSQKSRFKLNIQNVNSNAKY